MPEVPECIKCRNHTLVLAPRSENVPDATTVVYCAECQTFYNLKKEGALMPQLPVVKWVKM